MANLNDVRRKKITVKLNDGIERELKFDLNAMAELEEAYGSVDKAFEALEKNNSIKALRKVLWAGLLHEAEPLTEQQVGALVDITYMQDLIDSMTDAMTEDLPTQDQLVVANEANVAIADGASDPNEPTA